MEPQSGAPLLKSTQQEHCVQPGALQWASEGEAGAKSSFVRPRDIASRSSYPRCALGNRGGMQLLHCWSAAWHSALSTHGSRAAASAPWDASSGESACDSASSAAAASEVVPLALCEFADSEKALVDDADDQYDPVDALWDDVDEREYDASEDELSSSSSSSLSSYFRFLR